MVRLLRWSVQINKGFTTHTLSQFPLQVTSTACYFCAVRSMRSCGRIRLLSLDSLAAYRAICLAPVKLEDGIKLDETREDLLASVVFCGSVFDPPK